MTQARQKRIIAFTGLAAKYLFRALEKNDAMMREKKEID